MEDEEHALIHCPTHQKERLEALSKMGLSYHPNAMREAKTKWMFRLLGPSAEDAEIIGRFLREVWEKTEKKRTQLLRGEIDEWQE